MRRALHRLLPQLTEACNSQLRTLSGPSNVVAAAGSKASKMPQRHPRLSAADATAARPAAAEAAAAEPATTAASAAEAPAAEGTAAAAVPEATSTMPQGTDTLAAKSADELMAERQRQSAEVATRWMLFPWERRAFDGSTSGWAGLKTWEKMYWGLFAAALLTLLFSRVIMPAKAKKKEPEIDHEKEERKARLARALLAGQASFNADDADVFEGLTPAEIEAYVAKATEGATAADPFEGMSPEEINEYLEKNGTVALQ